jgi:hypothetical protein
VGASAPACAAHCEQAEPAKQTPRDRHIRVMAEKGRMAWQTATGYGRRSLGETAVGRCKHLIGPKLRARSLPGQRGEVALAVQALDRMIRAAKPVSVRIA